MTLAKRLFGWLRPKRENRATEVDHSAQNLKRAKESLKQVEGESRKAVLARLMGHALPERGTAKEVAEKLRVLEWALQSTSSNGINHIKGNFDVNGPHNSRMLGAFRAAHREYVDNIVALMQLRTHMLEGLDRHLDVQTMRQLSELFSPKDGK